MRKSDVVCSSVELRDIVGLAMVLKQTAKPRDHSQDSPIFPSSLGARTMLYYAIWLLKME